MMFSHEEQEEIINTFLANIDKKEEKKEQKDKIKKIKKPKTKAVHNSSNVEAHNKKINKIETKNYVPIKDAILKYYNKNDEKDVRYRYDLRLDKMIKNHGDILQIHKKGNKYVCSKERLEKMDFNITKETEEYYPFLDDYINHVN